MSKMIIMQGLPASGKSTRAAELVKVDNAIRINKDLLRTMMHFDRFNFRNEDLTRKAAMNLARYFLNEGKNIIIDDTNLNERTLDSWKQLALEMKAKIQYERMDTPWDECLRRDREREKLVGDHVIMGMAMQYGMYPIPEKGKGFILCDLDGTLCDIRHRLHFVKDGRREWGEFFRGLSDDSLNVEVAEMLKSYHEKGHKIFLVSARPDAYRTQTEEWLKAQDIPPYEALFMRADGDSRDDTIVKREMYEKYFSKFEIETVIDDRPKVIRMWRELGIPVIDCGAGVEF